MTPEQALRLVQHAKGGERPRVAVRGRVVGYSVVEYRGGEPASVELTLMTEGGRVVDVDASAVEEVE